jgi:hypothetical protein
MSQLRHQIGGDECDAFRIAYFLGLSQVFYL